VEGQVQSAFVTEESEQKPSARYRSTPENAEKMTRGGRQISTIVCFVCGEKGHLARQCAERAGTAMVTATTDAKDETRHTAYKVTIGEETAMFTCYDILLDNEAYTQNHDFGIMTYKTNKRRNVP
jgi:Zinc knuckle